MKKFNLRITDEEHEKMLQVKEETGVPVNLQLRLAWQKINETEKKGKK
jgi:hypothetical protein